MITCADKQILEERAISLVEARLSGTYSVDSLAQILKRRSDRGSSPPEVSLEDVRATILGLVYTKHELKEEPFPLGRFGIVHRLYRDNPATSPSGHNLFFMIGPLSKYQNI